MVWPFLAGVITTALGALLVHFLAHSRWWKEYRLRKLEELYTAMENHYVAIAEYYTRNAAYLIQPEDATGLEKQEEILRTEYIKALQEDEKKSAVIPMLINMYFKDLLSVWRSIEEAKRRLGKENQKAIMLDENTREALGKERRETICKGVAQNILKENLPQLAALKDEMCTQIVAIADYIGGGCSLPFRTSRTAKT